MSLPERTISCFRHPVSYRVAVVEREHVPAFEHAALLPYEECARKDGDVVHQHCVGAIVTEENLVVSLKVDQAQLAVHPIAGEGEHMCVGLSGNIAYEVRKDVSVHFEELGHLAEYLHVLLRDTLSFTGARSGVAELHQTQQHQGLVLTGYLMLDVAADTFYDGVLVQFRGYVVEVPQVRVQR